MAERQRRQPRFIALMSVALLLLTLIPATRMLAAPTAAAIYGDSLQGWSNWSWGGAYNLAATTRKQSGTQSISVSYQNGWAGLYLHADQPMATNGASTLRFFIHGGAKGGQHVRVCADNQCANGSFDVVAKANAWQQINVPLATFQSPATLSDLVWQDTTGGAQPTFYLDSISLIGTSSSLPVPTSMPATQAPATAIPATATQVPPTATGVPATAVPATAVPPTATGVPATAVPATATAIVPTATSVPATATAIPATNVPAPATSVPATAVPPGATSQPMNAATTPIFADSLTAGWASWSWGGDYNPNATTPVHSGATSFAVTYQGGWAGFYLHADQPVSTQGYSGLRFYVHGGSTGGQRLRFCSDTQCGRGQIDVAPQANSWTQIDVPFSAIGGPATLGELVWQDTTGGAQPTFYIDDLVLVAGTTVQPTAAPVAPGSGLALTVDANASQKPISPYIYGMNWPNSALASELKLPVQRWGGNAVTRYNWQNDTSNKASDWFFENIPSDNANPGALPNGSSADQFVEAGKRAGSQTLLQIPIIGWTPRSRAYDCAFPVSRYGAQQQTDQWRPDCGNGIKPDGSKLTGNDPNLTSSVIGPQFVQDWIRHLVGRYGTAEQGGVAFYNLDNEPGLWNSTHRDVHPQGASYDEIRDRSTQYGAAIKAADPSAKVVGPAEWGWTGYFYSSKDQEAGGAWWSNPQDRNAHGGTPFAAWYLQQMRAYEQQNGTRILDYFDLHYYPQAQDVTLQGAGDSATQARRLRSTRSLWDATYSDESWIGDSVRLIPRMHEWVDQNYPGTKLAIGEYNWGGLESINGALAQADVLGIFGREGVDLATLWAAPDANQPGAYAFRMYRNYDGNGGSFGETSVKATSADQDKLAVYAARRADGALTVMIVNKSGTDQAATLTLAGVPAGTAQVYRYSGTSLSAIVRNGDQAVNGNLSANFAKDSITLLVIRS